MGGETGWGGEKRSSQNSLIAPTNFGAGRIGADSVREWGSDSLIEIFDFGSKVEGRHVSHGNPSSSQYLGGPTPLHKYKTPTGLYSINWCYVKQNVRNSWFVPSFLLLKNSSVPYNKCIGWSEGRMIVPSFGGWNCNYRMA